MECCKLRKKQNIINLFNDREVYALKYVISITDEEDLNQLWEFIITIQSSDKSHSYPFFVYLYELSEKFLSTYPEMFFEIIIEESEKYYYFTVWNKLFVDFVYKYWKKSKIEHLDDKKKISARIRKRKPKIHKILEQQRIKTLLESTQEENLTAKIKAHDFISRHDLQELFDMCEDLNALIYNASQLSFEANSIIKLRSYFSLISVTLNHYAQLDAMALIMSEFSITINQNREKFFHLDTDQFYLLEGFARNFERWLKTLFVHGGAELNFMNNSMRADMLTIQASLEPEQKTAEGDIDDFFF